MSRRNGNSGYSLRTAYAVLAHGQKNPNQPSPSKNFCYSSLVYLIYASKNRGTTFDSSSHGYVSGVIGVACGAEFSGVEVVLVG